MNEEHGVRKRRLSAEEVRQLLAEFKSSGMSANEFCQKNGLCRSTLYRHLRVARSGKQEQAKRSPVIVPVEVTVPERTGQEGHGSLALVLASGHKIEVPCGFDETTLERLLVMLERG